MEAGICISASKFCKETVIQGELKDSQVNGLIVVPKYAILKISYVVEADTMYRDILSAIKIAADMNFEDASIMLENCVNRDTSFIDTIKQIGTIPESIAHDSTEEKLFSKASDAVLSRAFREIGLKSTVLKERGDSADVLAESSIHGYTLVADAKAFRMSRTAKNQKDFKVVALSGWRQDSDYAVLCSPYFQYPTKSSQIYSQAISHNVCLLSWEHLIFLIENGIKETADTSFSPLWAFCDAYSHEVLCSDMKKCFIPKFNATVLELIGLSDELFVNQLKKQIATISERGNQEKLFWQEEIKRIEHYSREEAISELIKAKKIHEKIAQIDTYIKGLQI